MFCANKGNLVQRICVFPFRSNITWIDRGGRERRVSCGEFERLCQQYASRWARQSARELCLIWEPSVEAYAAFVGALLSGKRPAFFSNPTHKLDRAYFERQIEALGHQGVSIFGSPHFRELGLVQLPDEPDTAPRPEMPRSAIVFSQYSSGTTGLRKKIDYDVDALAQHNLEYADALHLGPKETVISWLPHYHDMGLIACLLLPLQLGHDLVAMSNMSWIGRPSLLVDAAQAHRATLCWQPNFAFQLLADRARPANLSSTRFISCAEPVLEATCRDFEAKFRTRVTGSYAMAENIFAITQGDEPADHRTIRGSGRPFGTNEVKIVDGEIAIRSDYLFKEYVTGEPSRLRDGWFYTRDHGHVVDGELFVLGRMDDAFKIQGVKIIPELVEAEVNRIPGISPGRVACVCSARGRDQIALLLYEGSIDRKDLLRRVSTLGVRDCVQLPNAWLIKSSSGKIARKACLQKYSDSLEG